MNDHSTKKTWQATPYQSGDEAKLAILFAQVFSRTLTPAEWMWKLKNHDINVENVWLGRANGNTIFQYAAIPTRCQMDQKEQIVMVLVIQ